MISPPDFRQIRVDVPAPAATITPNRPHAVSAITVDMLTELGTAFEAPGSDRIDDTGSRIARFR